MAFKTRGRPLYFSAVSRAEVLVFIMEQSSLPVSAHTGTWMSDDLKERRALVAFCEGDWT